MSTEHPPQSAVNANATCGRSEGDNELKKRSLPFPSPFPESALRDNSKVGDGRVQHDEGGGGRGEDCRQLARFLALKLFFAQWLENAIYPRNFTYSRRGRNIARPPRRNPDGASRSHLSVFQE